MSHDRLTAVSAVARINETRNPTTAPGAPEHGRAPAAGDPTRLCSLAFDAGDSLLLRIMVYASHMKPENRRERSHDEGCARLDATPLTTPSSSLSLPLLAPFGPLHIISSVVCGADLRALLDRIVPPLSESSRAHQRKMDAGAPRVG